MQITRSLVKSNKLQTILAAAITLLLTSALQAAPSNCKVLSNLNQCERDVSCTWVKGYTTKSGTKVNAYCRSKPVKRSSQSSKTATSKNKVAKTSEKESIQVAK